MKRISVFLFLGALSLGFGCATFPPGRPTSLEGNPPIIRHYFASDKISYGDTWKIYVEVEDPDGDMRQFVCTLSQVGYGYYPPCYVGIKNQHRKKMRGYLKFLTSAGASIRSPEWTQLNLILYTRDRGKNVSNKVVFSVVFSQGAKQKAPPPPFDSGTIEALGTIPVDLTDLELGRGEFED